MDCTRVDVDYRISFHFLHPLQNENEILIEPLDNATEKRNTCKLLVYVYCCELCRQLLGFDADIREYLEMDDHELSNRSEYTAFKRWLILAHKEVCRDLLPLLKRT